MTESALTKHQHALQYAALGIRVFPLWPGTKIPALQAWQHAATTETAKVDNWWEENPHYNIGVATGRGIIAIDADVKKGKPGAQSLDALDLEILPTTFRASTPSGGSHTLLIVDRTIANRADTVDGYPGIDIRGENGYIVGIGSTTPEGTYTALNDAPIATAPDALYEVLGKRPNHQAHTDTPVVDLDTEANVAKATTWLMLRAPKAIEGEGGDQNTFQTAAMLRDFGLSQAVALDLMLEHWNESHAEPPWQPDELALKVQNAFTYATGSWGGKTAAADFDTVDEEFDVSTIDIGTPPSKEAIAAAQGKTPPKRWKIYQPGASKLKATATPLNPLIDGIINQNSFVVLYGAPNAAKTFNALDMAGAIASGQPWCGRETSHGAVLYIATEGEGGIFRRIAALAIHRGLTDDAPLFLAPVGVNLGTTEEDARAIARYGMLAAKKADLPLRLVVVDTLARSLGGGDENSAQDMGAFIRNIDLIREETGATTMVIHHTGKDENRGARGHSSLFGAADTEILVRKDGEIETTKQRDLEMLKDPLLFKLVDQAIGEDPTGRELHSAIVEYVDVSEFDAPAVLTSDELALFEVFKRLAEVSELEGRKGVVTWREWLFAFYRSRDTGWREGERPPFTERHVGTWKHAIEGVKYVIKDGRNMYRLGRGK
ncbi:hypothetical protein GGQ64_005362 [Rhizobium azooxidifex]|uniref:DNA primase/polymerase bifunctional N-terminal domain-containing protein n=1 Tax=Mycoplana azooxidifex TaxID=1636188 RepID=A0A7W6DGD4_9HYPH|nr:AAA family ATPase [Mycoplana azooxidifex]MBB3980115.1 hypothetical protein [Mycoplana azooxidifex]